MSISFDRVAEIYDKTRGLPLQAMEKVVDTLIKELTGYKNILDVGVGTGRFAKPLQDNGFKVVGIDISLRMLNKAKDGSTENILLSDACQLPFRNSIFDAALCVHVLHLMSDWKAALREICRVTTDVLVSLIDMRPRPLSDAYEELLQKHGFNITRPGLRLSEFKETVKPAKSVFAVSYEMSADDRLAYLSQRAFSRQWDIPESINNQIVSELREKFAGKKHPQEINVLSWKIEDLKAYLRNEMQQ